VFNAACFVSYLRELASMSSCPWGVLCVLTVTGEEMSALYYLQMPRMCSLLPQPQHLNVEGRM